MAVSGAGLVKGPKFAPGDVVRVRVEPSWGAVMLPAHRECDAPGDEADFSEMFCVPTVLVRTPADDENGVKRWVEISDLTLMEPD